MTPLPDDPYSAEIDALLKPSINLVEDFRSHHDPDDLYMALQDSFKEAKAALNQIVRKARLDELGRTPIHADAKNIFIYQQNRIDELQQPDDTTKEVK